jgi:hypothetical protein
MDEDFPVLKFVHSFMFGFSARKGDPVLVVIPSPVYIWLYEQGSRWAL